MQAYLKSRAARAAIGAGLTLGAVALVIQTAGAHKGISSKYTYNDDIFPIVRDRCGKCHTTGGIAPMSLLNYKDAVPWAEAIREELVNERMPPWHAQDGGTPLRAPRPLTAREIDALIMWSTGGTPEGDPSTRPKAADGAARDWPAGKPDLVLSAVVEHTIPADKQEDSYEATVATGVNDARTIRAIDLLPSNAALVRSATISIQPASGPPREILAWFPGDATGMAPEGAGYRLPAGASLRVSVTYKKPWQEERNAVSDRSQIGLYFAPAAARAIESMTLEAKAASPAASFGADLKAALSVVAIRPVIDQPYESVTIDIVRPDKTRTALLKLNRPRPEWARRYWLQQAAAAPAGSRIEVSTTPLAPDPERPAASPPPHASQLRVSIEHIAGR